MTEPTGHRGLIRFYCTAGRGMEPFLTEEVKEKLAAQDVCQMPGRVLFSSSTRIERVSELKAAERLFLLLKHDASVQLSGHTSQAKASCVLQSRLLGDGTQWTNAVLTWSRLQGELANRRTASPISALGVKRKASEGPREEEETESSCTQNGKKRLVTETGLDVRGSVGVHTTTASDHKVESSCWNVDDKAEDCAVENVDHAETTGEDEIILQPHRIKPETCSSVPVSFRVSCKCTGSVARYFSSQEVSRVLGVGLGRLLGWKADLKNPQLEVNVCLSDDHYLVGIPLTRLPLAHRSYIKTTGLRSTVAWAMASLAQIQPGFCVVDPMCGVGTILIEAAQEHKTSCFLGMDIDDRQLQKASENMEFAELGNRIQLLKASSIVLPLPSASVDAVLCDLPFGRKFDTKTNMAAKLPLIISEMERILCVGGTLVLLLSPQLSCLLKKLLAQKDPGPASYQETKPQTGIQDCISPMQEMDTQCGLTHSLPSTLSSLKHQTTLRVSLGAIDGLIHKYIKMHL